MSKEDALKLIAKRLRADVLRMTTAAGSGHATTCLSMAELMSCLFFDEMKFNVKNPDEPSNDEFVLSKGHAAPILYATYAEAGAFPVKRLDTLRQFGSALEGHPTPDFPWAKAATGSLGQGLSIGVGMALGIRMAGLKSRVFVMLGDGELAEGSVWEAAALASKMRLNNIVVIVDANRLGQSGESLHGHNVEQWREKFVAFGWEAAVVDGHNVHDILEALSLFRTQQFPCVLIAKTMKGKGVSFLVNKEGWHGRALKQDELERAFKELGPIPDIDASTFVKAPPKAKLPKIKMSKMAKPDYGKETIATREAYGNGLVKLGAACPLVVALDGDVKNSTFSEKFKEKYPQRFVECYIAEQNMVGMAVGLSAKGFVPFASTFGAFMTRAHDQIRMAGIGRADIKLVGSHNGVSIGEDGPSQMGLEDLTLFRSIPECVVLYPSDAVSTEKCVELLANHEGIGYLRTTRPKTPVIYKNSESFKIGGSKVMKHILGDKAVIIAAGITVHEALKAAEQLEKEKIKVRVIDAYSVKPLDASTILSAAKGRKVIVVEDHYPEGGLGEAVASLGIPITHLCIKEIPKSGTSEALMHAYKIDAEAIVKTVKKLV